MMVMVMAMVMAMVTTVTLPMPEPTEMSVSLTSGGESAVNQVGAGAEIVVDVAVAGLTASSV